MEHEIQNLLTDLRSGVISREEFVRKCLAAGATLSAIGMLLHNSDPARAAGAARPAGARKGGTLRVAIQGPSTGLDPAIISDPATIEITHNMYNFLVRVDVTFTPYPDLATKWTTSKDGKTWTFPLHRNVKFHSGKACTADDVLYTFERIRNPKTGSAAASLLSGVTDIRKLDDYTVQFSLKAADPDFAVTLSDYHLCIIEKGFSGNFSKNPSGTGPWKLKEFVPGDHCLLVRNPNYFEAGLPYLDGIRFVFLPDASTQVAGLRSGSIDFIEQLTPTQAQPLVGVSGINLVTMAGSGFFNMRMRSDRPPFNDLRVRQAFKYVVDRKAINNVVFVGKGALGNDQPIAPVFKWYSDIGLRPRDVAKAKSLLAAAGHPKGITVNLVASPFVGGSDFAQAYQQLASDAGIDVKIVTETGADYFAKDWLQVDFGLTSWAGRPTPGVLLNLLFKSGAVWNEAHYSNKQLDKLIDASGSELNPSKRKAIYKQIELLISNDGPSIIPFFSTFVFAGTSKLKGFQPLPDTFHYFKTAWLSS